MNSPPEIRLVLAGLMLVRIAWIAAFLVAVLIIVSELVSGTDRRDPSQQLPGFAFTDGGDSSQQLPEFALFDPAASVVGGGAALQGHRSQRAKEQPPGESVSSPGLPHRSGSQPKDAVWGAPEVTPRPNPPQAPSVTQPKRPQAPSVTRPEPPQAPSVTPVSSQPPVSVSVSAPVKTSVTVTNNSVGVTVANQSVGLP